MDQTWGVDDHFLFKLEVLRLLSERESIGIHELTGILGISESDVKALLRDLGQNFMIMLEKNKVSWFHGDNPGKIKPWGWNYIYKQLTGSTLLSAKYYEPWAIIIAEYQSRGYGRHGRRWISNLGGVWLTAKIEINPGIMQYIPIVVPVILVRFLREKFKINAYIKWPNDIVSKDKKLSGFLVEGELLANRFIAYIGIGINVNNEPPLEEATSIKYLTGRLVPRNSIIGYIAGYLAKLEDIISRDSKRIFTEYLDMLETIGRRVRVKLADREITGKVTSITETGELVVETDTGTYKLKSEEVLNLRYLD